MVKISFPSKLRRRDRPTHLATRTVYRRPNKPHRTMTTCPSDHGNPPHRQGQRVFRPQTGICRVSRLARRSVCRDGQTPPQTALQPAERLPVGRGLSGGIAGLHRHGLGRTHRHGPDTRAMQGQVPHYRGGEQTHRRDRQLSPVYCSDGYPAILDLRGPDRGFRAGTPEHHHPRTKKIKK